MSKRAGFTHDEQARILIEERAQPLGRVGVADAGGALQGIATIPEGLWELSLGIYCTVKGFRPSSPILRADIA